MSEVIKTIYERRAVRKYKDMPIAKELIDQLIAAGRMAPSAMNRQPWKFYILTDRRMIMSFSKQIAKAALHAITPSDIKEAIRASLAFFHLSTIRNLLQNDDHIFHGAPVVILITVPRDDEWGAIDVGMCAQNIMLAAKAMGLDTCPIGFAKFIAQTEDYHLLNIPAAEQVDLAIVLGYGAEHPEVHTRVENNVTYI